MPVARPSFRGATGRGDRAGSQITAAGRTRSRPAVSYGCPARLRPPRGIPRRATRMVGSETATKGRYDQQADPDGENEDAIGSDAARPRSGGRSRRVWQAGWVPARSESGPSSCGSPSTIYDQLFTIIYIMRTGGGAVVRTSQPRIHQSLRISPSCTARSIRGPRAHWHGAQ